MSDLSKCESCGSTDTHYRYSDDGEVSAVVCHICGHDEPVFHITKRGREVLEILLGDKLKEKQP